MKEVFKIFAKDTELNNKIKEHNFPTYKSAETAIMYLPNGIYAIEKQFIKDIQITEITDSTCIINGKTVTLEGNQWVTYLNELTTEEQEMFKMYINNSYNPFKDLLNDNPKTNNTTTGYL